MQNSIAEINVQFIKTLKKKLSMAQVMIKEKKINIKIQLKDQKL